MDAQERTWTLRAGDGVRLHVRSWPAGAERAVLLVSHGLGEHGGRYDALAADLGPRGITVHALDHRGHGRSGGQRGHVARFGDLVRDLETFRADAARRHPPGTPMVLLGHSLGGLIAIRHLQTHPAAPLRGAVLSAPLLGIALPTPGWMRAAAPVLARLAPRLPFPNGIEPEMLSSVPGFARAYRADPLVHRRITPRLYAQMLRAMDRAFDQVQAVSMPLLVVAPQADPVVQVSAVERFAAACPGPVRLQRYEGFRHEAHNDRGRERVVADVAAWVLAAAG